MKIVLNIDSDNIHKAFIHIFENTEHQLIHVKNDNDLFDIIEKDIVDAYILSSTNSYFKKATEFIKKSNPYIPVVGLLSNNTLMTNVSVDLWISIDENYEYFVKQLMYNINMYIKNFRTLKKLTTKMHDKIEFGPCIYDPTRRILYHNNKEIKKLSSKEGCIIEVLASNYGQIVKKDTILEKVWHKTDYFVGRSCDVYLTYIRNTFKQYNIKLTIKNISGIGLMLE